MAQEFDVVCLGGGVAGEAIAVGLEGSGLTLAVVERELVLAIKLGTPLNTLADVIHPFPALNRMLGESLNQLAAKVAGQGEHHEHEQYASEH